MKGATGYGPDGARNPSSLLAEPCSLLRQHVEHWSNKLEDSPTDEDFDGVSEALIIALECGGYPVTDLHQGHVEIAYVESDGGPRLGNADTLRGTILCLRAIQRKHESTIKQLRRDLIDAKASENRAHMLVELQRRGSI